MRTPVALQIAFAVAAAMQIAGASPTPFAPWGPSPSIVSMKRTSTFFIPWSAAGMPLLA